jgi:hypothetical protein
MFVVEIAAVVVILVVILFVVEISPYLASASQSSQIGMYNQKEFAKGTVTLAQGQNANAQFNYTTYDPAILVVDVSFQSWQNPGFLSIYCNGRVVATVYAAPDTPKLHFTTISVSGWDYVKSPSIDSFTYGNEVSFVSGLANGYAGDFSYEISIRGSR